MRASTLTLGELLYADPAIACISEKEWSTLVRAIAAGDEAALRILFEKTYSVVFTFLMRMTGDRRIAEEVILEVFDDVWCEAPVFDGANESVFGWIMRHARVRALSKPPAAQQTKSRINGALDLLNDATLGTASVAGARDASGLVAMALTALDQADREAMEGVLLNGLSYAQFAIQSGQSVGAVKKRLRSGLSKLQQALQAQGGEA